MEDSNRKVWSYYDDALILRFLDFLKDNGKNEDSPDAEEMFDKFLSEQGDDTYVYWESFWESPIDEWVNWKNHGGDDASSVGVRK